MEVSSPDFEEVSSMLKRESRSVMGIQSAVDALKSLDDFLETADPKSVEELTTVFVGSLSELSESERVAEFLKGDSLLNISKILQEPRIIDFLRKSGQQLSESGAIRNRAEDEDEDEYADSDSKAVAAWLKEEAPQSRVTVTNFSKPQSRVTVTNFEKTSLSSSFFTDDFEE